MGLSSMLHYALLSCWLVCFQPGQKTVIPRFAERPEGFCPKGWRVRGKPVFGDLNKDGIPDLALVVKAKNEVDGEWPQMLVVALGLKSGGYRSATTRIPVAQDGELGVKQHGPEINIQRGTLLVEEGGGSNNATYDSRDRYALRNGHWTHIGHYFEGVSKDGLPADAMALPFSKDINLITGLVIEERVRLDAPSKRNSANDVEEPPTHLEKRSHKEIFSGLLTTDSELQSNLWNPAPWNQRATILGREDLKLGAKGWSGTQDLSATVKSVHDLTNFYIQAWVTDDHLICIDPSSLSEHFFSIIRQCVGSRTDGLPTVDQSDIRGLATA